MPEPTLPKLRKSFGVVEPQLLRGEPVHGRYLRPEWRNPFARHVELARQNPPWENPEGEFVGGWVLCSRVTGSAKRGSRETHRRILADQKSLQRYVERKFPLERFQVSVVTVADTWCDRELYVRYLYTLTVEEDILDRKRRREHYEWMMRRREEKKAEARLRVARSEAKSQARRGVEG
jgi:hypothetical protein